MKNTTQKKLLKNSAGEIIFDDADQLSTYFFIFSIFFYPFIAASHSIYLGPQLLLCVVSSVKLLRKKNKAEAFGNSQSYLLYLSLIFFVLWSSSVETLTDDPYYDFPLKMALNTVTIALVANANIKLDFRKIVTALPYMAFLWLSTTVFVYSSSDNLAASLLGLFVTDSLNSSDLYGIASPLEKIFLTKNITAIFFVACLAIYLCGARLIKKRISFLAVSLFFFLVLSFLSRQAILAVFAIFFIYFLTSENISILSKAVASSVACTCAISFLFIFFNFENPNDGANERLLLWQNFSDSYHEFFWTGIGYNALKAKLILEVGIDNYHTFFMNQISTYGIFFFLSFNLFIIEIFRNSEMPKTSSVMLGSVYFLNVLFQTFGFEYQNTCLLLLVATNFTSAPQSVKELHA